MHGIAMPFLDIAMARDGNGKVVHGNTVACQQKINTGSLMFAEKRTDNVELDSALLMWMFLAQL